MKDLIQRLFNPAKYWLVRDAKTGRIVRVA